MSARPRYLASGTPLDWATTRPLYVAGAVVVGVWWSAAQQLFRLVGSEWWEHAIPPHGGIRLPDDVWQQIARHPRARLEVIDKPTATWWAADVALIQPYYVSDPRRLGWWVVIPARYWTVHPAPPERTPDDDALGPV